MDKHQKVRGHSDPKASQGSSSQGGNAPTTLHIELPTSAVAQNTGSAGSGGPVDVHQPARHQVVHQQPTTRNVVMSRNVVIKHIHHHRTHHYHAAPVYQGSVIKGDIVGSKAQIKDASIGAIGGTY
uniref:uncharacterized protein LOC120337420 n=1 Tax=Styela clava TaxID=7725 RepID=UPI001939D12D|nr:uncharacterized protein LOC120337420 [Styela clava]